MVWCYTRKHNHGIKEHGKPFAKDLAVKFNISHSGDMVVCAVDDIFIVIDIEQIRPIDLTVAKRICIDEELLYLFGHTPTEQDFTYTTDTKILTRFFELWTAKEAYGKCFANGILKNKNMRLASYPESKSIYIKFSGNYILSVFNMDFNI